MDIEQIDSWLETHKHLTGRHNQKRHGWRGGDTNAIYQTAERMVKAGDRAEAIEFLRKTSATAGYIPYAAMRGNAIGGLSKSEMATIRSGMESFAKTADKRHAKDPLWAGRGTRALQEFESAVANQWKPRKEGRAAEGDDMKSLRAEAKAQGLKIVNRPDGKLAIRGNSKDNRTNMVAKNPAEASWLLKASVIDAKRSDAMKKKWAFEREIRDGGKRANAAQKAQLARLQSEIDKINQEAAENVRPK